MYNVAINEQETILNYGRAEQGCWIYTSDTTTMTKLDKMCRTSDNYKLKAEHKVDNSVVAKEYYLSDKSLLSFRSKKIDRELTPEQKAYLSEQMTKRNKSQGRGEKVCT